MLSFLKFVSNLFHSLEKNEIGSMGAATLGGALRVNQTIETLRYV